MKKKYQIFISSTYTDLQKERQAAVEAVLSARHIPAGMELFTSSDETQLDVIKRWIDSSDIYCLILGGRYGSIEPKSGKSYIELEYDYAADKKKPMFAIVINDIALAEKTKIIGKDALEQINKVQYIQFKDKVTSKICRFFDDTKDIKIAIHETLNDMPERYSLGGWISSSEVPNISTYIEEIDTLKSQIKTLKSENLVNQKVINEMKNKLNKDAKISDIEITSDISERLNTL